MKKVILLALLVAISGCSMTPQQRQALARGMHNVSVMNTGGSYQRYDVASEIVYCYKSGDLSGQVYTFRGFCPFGYYYAN